MNKKYAGIGSRETPERIMDLMAEVALELNSLGYTLHSGGAKGADKAFEVGAGSLKMIWRPEHNNSDSYDLAAEYHPRWDELSSHAQGLIARNGFQVLGADLNTPVDFILCWTPGGATVGGTAQALRIAKAWRIPVYNMGDPEHSVDRLIEFLTIHTREP